MTIPEPLQELVARSKKIGKDDDLVLCGGGNTSSKGEVADYLGKLRKVLWVKGSGVDMQEGQAVDYPGLYLEELLSLVKFEDLDDESMVNFIARALVDPTSRRPSIETLLHAFLPAKHIDHVHADAICALTNHPNGRAAIQEALGDRFAYVDWLRPGFELSKVVSGFKDYQGIVLAHHGLIVWDENSDICLSKTHDAVSRANKYLDSLDKRPKSAFVHHELSDAELSEFLLKLRGSIGKRKVLHVDSRLAEVAGRPDLIEILAAGTSSADHMLRIGPMSAQVTISDPVSGIENYRAENTKYFESHQALLPNGYHDHGEDPRVVMVPGMGSVSVADTLGEASIIADIATHTHQVAAKVRDAFGNGSGLTPTETFKFDYWPMQLFKLNENPIPTKFTGQTFIVTGSGSGIGRGIVLELGRLGANVTIADVDAARAEIVRKEFKANGYQPPLIFIGDQSNEDVVKDSVRTTIKHFGGIDGAVINAGIGVSDNLESLDVAKWRKGLEINLTSAFLLTKEMMKVLRLQNLGGSLVFIASKNAFAPGTGFGGYSVTKAGMIQLMRIAALEGGSVGIRSNAINPDAIFDDSHLWEGGVREQRAAAHGVDPDKLEDFYASRNLLKAHVRSFDVAQAVSFFLGEESSRTTGSVLAVDGGVAAAFPR